MKVIHVNIPRSAVPRRFEARQMKQIYSPGTYVDDSGNIILNLDMTNINELFDIPDPTTGKKVTWDAIKRLLEYLNPPSEWGKTRYCKSMTHKKQHKCMMIISNLRGEKANVPNKYSGPPQSRHSQMGTGATVEASALASSNKYVSRE